LGALTASSSGKEIPMSTRYRSLVLATFAALAFVAAGCTPSSSDAPSPATSAAPAAVSSATSAAAPRNLKGPDGTVSSADCGAIMRRLMDVTGNEEPATDPELKNASPAEREIIRKAMRSEALKDPEMKKIVAECRTELRGKAYECIMKAKTTKQID